MAPVLDVDSHWTVPWEFRLKEGPLRHWAEKLPGEAEQIGFFLAADALKASTRDKPDVQMLFPQVAFPDGTPTHIPLHFQADRRTSTVDERLAWMDAVGIDFSLVNGPAFPALFATLEDAQDRARYLRECNELLRDMTDDPSHRLSMVTYADLTDLGAAIEELERGRGAGSRALSLRAEPVEGMSLAHPHFDRLWAAVVDLGMVLSLHVGFSPALFGDWANLGIDFAAPGGVGQFLRYANSHRHQGAESFLSAMIFGGALSRNPRLTILISELHVFWLPSFSWQIEMLGRVPVLGEWPYSRTPGEMLRQQVKASPLPGLGDISAVDVLEQLPEMIVFSSDYPHAEGNAHPIELYGSRLQNLPAITRDAFLGQTIVDAFARTGDPLDLSERTARAGAE